MLTNKTHTSQPQSHKAYLLMVILIGFSLFLCINLVSGLNLDNSKDYDYETRTTTITNAFGMGKEIATIKLNTELHVNTFSGVDRKVAEFTIDNHDSYSDWYDDMEFYDLNNNEKEIQRGFTYKYYSKDKWIELNKYSQLPKGKIRIGVFTNVKKGDYVEWIPTLFGVEIEEWATWSSSLDDRLIAWWSFENDVLDRQGEHDGTAYKSPTYTTGIQGNAIQLNGVDQYVNVTHSDSFNFGTANFTIALWINASGLGQAGLVTHANYADWDSWTVFLQNDQDVKYGQDNSEIDIRSDKLTANVTWDFIVVVKNSTNVSIWQNNTLISMAGNLAITDLDHAIQFGRLSNFGQYYSGLLDEVGIWNKSLTDAEISTLWNDGEGLRFGEYHNVTLNNPSDNLRTVNSSMYFNCSVQGGIYDIDNVTVYVNGVANHTTIHGTSNYTESDVTLSGFDVGSYEWTCQAYDNITQSVWALSNWTFNRTTFKEVAVSYDTGETFETSYEHFQLNITVNATFLALVSKLNYNGTDYTSTVSCDGINCQLDNYFDLPKVKEANNHNKTFFWNVTIFDGNSKISSLSSQRQQNVSKLYLTECGTTYNVEALNFTAYNETNLVKLSNFTFKGTFEYWLGQGTVKQNYSMNNVTGEEYRLCISQNKTYYLDAEIDYSTEVINDSYKQRNYFFDNATLTNVTQKIFLYLLDSNDATSFIIQVLNQEQSAVINALVYIERYYPQDNNYRIVQIAKTDGNGKTAGFYVTETVHYRHRIFLDSVLQLVTEKQKILPESVPYTLTFTIGDAPSYPWSSFENNTIFTNLSFNTDTNLTTFSWIDDTGATTEGRLLVYKIIHDNNDQLICNTSLAFSTASITCNITGFTGSFKAYGYVTKTSNKYLTDLINFFISSAKDIFDKTGLMMGWFIILTATLAFVWNPTAMIVVHNLAVIFVSLIGFIAFSPVYIFSMIAVSIILIIFLDT